MFAMRAADVADRDVAEWMGPDGNVMRGTYDRPSAESLGAPGQALSDVLGGRV